MEKVIEKAIEKTLFEKANEDIAKAVKATKIVAQEVKTGTSYFEGKSRLCKVLKTKKGITMEINVTLTKAVEEEFGLEKISAKTAYEKHLGTMKYMARFNDGKQINKLLKLMVAAFIQQNKKEIAK